MGSPSDQVFWVYVTAPSREVALALARDVVAARLAACVNVLPGMTSVYEWQGKLVEESEVAMVLKTNGETLQALQARLAELHPYDVPCIVALPIASGHQPFLSWVHERVGPRDE